MLYILYNASYILYVLVINLQRLVERQVKRCLEELEEKRIDGEYGDKYDSLDKY